MTTNLNLHLSAEMIDLHCHLNLTNPQIRVQNITMLIHTFTHYYTSIYTYFGEFNAINVQRNIDII